MIICRIIKRLKSILKYFVFIALHMCQARKFITCTSGTFEQRALSWKSDWNNNNEMLVNERNELLQCNDYANCEINSKYFGGG